MQTTKKFLENILLFSARLENGSLSSQMQTTSQNMLSTLDNVAVAVLALTGRKSPELGSNIGSGALPRRSREVSSNGAVP
jgi:hypothetical protein